MLITIIILLIIQAVISVLGLYLYWKDMPAESQKAILRKIEPPKSEVLEWQSPEQGETKAFKKAVEEINVNKE